MKKTKKKPRGRVPKGMMWSDEDERWVVDPSAPPREKPYVAVKDRKPPAPQGRPFANTRWCHDTQRYVLKTPHEDVGKAVFKLDIPPQPSKKEWSTPDPEPEASP